MNLRITRRGCLAVHLMPKYHGARLENAVERIARYGDCRNEHEREAMRLANGEISRDPEFPELDIKNAAPGGKE